MVPLDLSFFTFDAGGALRRMARAEGNEGPLLILAKSYPLIRFELLDSQVPAIFVEER